ncbi:hypothetical protein QE374_000841 [Microbacterium sp. SORGH_AS428]|uniref:DUF1206 domain-containing protein n=1 Tax=Microbacterium sp. SORGH_AS_0428 TaxID=3041788 RepID=UPI002861E207|nr:DUF1206 domain-containing protein [Microbacterium sp. SORGH_AS_0428]MDR6198932.1 hypothetical protein [Microbacterium sp. SORGH_AS_0428]
MSTPKKTARRIESDPRLRTLAKAGYAATGLVHVLLGSIVLAVAFGGDGDADQSGAFQALAASPAGLVALWAVALALLALALWHAVAAFAGAGEKGSWSRRLSEAGQAVAFAALGVIAISVAIGGRSDGDASVKETSSGVLSLPGGALILGAVGAGVLVAGIAFGAIGVRRSFRKKLSVPTGAMGTLVVTLGVVGYVAKGVSLATVGVLLGVAAIRVDPQEAGGLDGAVRSLLELPAGPVIAIAVGGGLIAYGLFCLFRARYARL